MSLKRSLKSFALANTVAVFAISLPATAQGVSDSPFADDVAPPATAENVANVVAIRQVPSKNYLSVANPAMPIRVQLTKFDGTRASELAGTALTIVSPDSTQARFKVNNEGVVLFQAQRSGLYAFITSGPMGHAAFPVVVKLGDEATAGDSTGGSPTIALPIFTLEPGVALRAINSFVPPTKWMVADIDASLLSSGEVTATIDFRVNLTEAGRMEGQVVTLMREGLVNQSIEGNNLLLYQDGKLIARAISDQLGRFAFEDLQPGNYGIICAGPGGYAAFGFQAIMPALSAASLDRKTFVATTAQQPPAAGPFASGDVLPIVPIPNPLFPGLVETLEEADETEELLPLEPEFAFSPVPGGGGAGFGGGGAGAGGGGMGGAGGLLGLAGLGLAAAAAASDSNDRVIVNPTPDPATPANVLP